MIHKSYPFRFPEKKVRKNILAMPPLDSISHSTYPLSGFFPRISSLCPLPLPSLSTAVLHTGVRIIWPAAMSRLTFARRSSLLRCNVTGVYVSSLAADTTIFGAEVHATPIEGGRRSRRDTFEFTCRTIVLAHYDYCYFSRLGRFHE